MRVILTGASGLMGAHIAQVAARRGHEVVAIVGRWVGEIPGSTRMVALDLADPAPLQRLVLDYFPDAIINAAAISDPAQCDAGPERSASINVALPTALAQLAHHLSARLIHLSSEQVFDGRHAPYTAGDAVRPVNLYGRQKAEAEQEVARFAPELATIVRLPLLAGNSLRGTRSVHERLFGLWTGGQRARLFSDEIRQPCTAENGAEVVVELIERNDVRGVMHWAGARPLSRWELGRRVAEHFKLPLDQLIERAQQGDDPASAGRQPDLSLDCAPVVGKLKTPPEDIEQLLEKLHVPAPCRDWYRRQ